MILMDIKQIFIRSLDESQSYLEKSLNELSQDELSWTPKSDCGSIIFIFWHLARVEDFWINRILKGGDEIYESDGWQKLLGTPEKESGVWYDEEKLKSWPVPDKVTLINYASAARKQTLDYLSSLEEKDYLREIHLRDRVNTVTDCLTHLITEIALHVGQIDYLRGIIRGLQP